MSSYRILWTTADNAQPNGGFFIDVDEVDRDQAVWNQAAAAARDGSAPQLISVDDLNPAAAVAVETPEG